MVASGASGRGCPFWTRLPFLDEAALAAAHSNGSYINGCTVAFFSISGQPNSDSGSESIEKLNFDSKMQKLCVYDAYNEDLSAAFW